MRLSWKQRSERARNLIALDLFRDERLYTRYPIRLTAQLTAVLPSVATETDPEHTVTMATEIERSA